MTLRLRLVLVDNYDSFVYNLAQSCGALGAQPVVVRSDATLRELAELEPDAIVISPGPGGPLDAGVSMDAIARFGERLPILGVCLGHQCIGAVFGADVRRAAVGPVHGKTSVVTHDGKGVFDGAPSPFEATRYHSLAVDEASVPAELIVTAHSDDGTVMGLRHVALPIEGVQFHPESVLTAHGDKLLYNFLEGARARAPA